jgi:natural product biosynthesis luciferase-like monooxygenase protein
MFLDPLPKGEAWMKFGIMFFSSFRGQSDRNIYNLLIEASKFADQNGFCCVWTPERHFHEFGGGFPNPSLTSAVLSIITNRLQIRAGSLISPLHDVIRIAEEWAVVDNLSEGRVAISFGSGWNVNDFIFYTDRYSRRHEIMSEQIETLKLIWKGEPIVRKSSFDKEVSIKIYPQPIQKELPIWITSSGNVNTFNYAGQIGANVLTHLIGQDIQSLAKKIQVYRKAREDNGFDPNQGIVSLMLHTFMGATIELVKAKVKNPFCQYLKTAISLEQMSAIGGGTISGGHKIEPHTIPDSVMEQLLDITFERYFNNGSLMGTLASSRDFIWKLKNIGVDEIACLIDFLQDCEGIMESLRYVNELRISFATASLQKDERIDRPH